MIKKSSLRRPLGLHDYWVAVGTDALKLVLERAGVSFESFRLMSYHARPCTPQTFEKIEEAARKLTMPILPDYETCTRPSVYAQARERRANNRAAGVRQPRML